ncbi:MULTISPECIES: hypothetical protein [unclassified Legionella]|uniref:hypothetical protein n=1 Tax=Legionella sp. PC997 TaxID=2755562 RepID=UPI0015FB61FD|nr:hypothetical protein [Legionella sp. PC997]QMT61798.1 hypothetical protein HBNCFIEN_03204 [Legionella sp. PC997]
MLTIKLLRRVIFAGCLLGITVLFSSCNTSQPDQPISSSNEKGYGGEGGGGH